MKKPLTRIKSKLYHYKDGEKVDGDGKFLEEWRLEAIGTLAKIVELAKNGGTFLENLQENARQPSADKNND